jgi:hypothetical protein
MNQTPAAFQTRNKEIIDARIAGHTLQAIASRHGITRQRVDQILRRANLSPNKNRRSARLKACVDCGTAFWTRAWPRFCAECRAKRLRACRDRPEARALRRAYYQRPEVRARKRAYHQRPEVRARIRAYSQRPEVRARKRAYRQQREERARKHRTGEAAR